MFQKMLGGPLAKNSFSQVIHQLSLQPDKRDKKEDHNYAEEVHWHQHLGDLKAMRDKFLAKEYWDGLRGRRDRHTRSGRLRLAAELEDVIEDLQARMDMTQDAEQEGKFDQGVEWETAHICPATRRLGGQSMLPESRNDEMGNF